jgi:hypothetical protein
MLNFIKRLFGIKPEADKAPAERSATVHNNATESPITEINDSKAEVEQAAAKPEIINSAPASDFNSMTVNQLLEYAAINGVEVKKSWRKAKIIEAIEGAQ